MVNFIAHPPGTQDPDTYRQFQELQTVLTRLEERIAPVYGSDTVEPLVLTDAWQPLVLTNGTGNLPSDPAAYYVALRLGVTGSTANAFIQMRLISGGITIEGSEVTIGNNDLESVTLTAPMTLEAGELIIEARGGSTEILSGRFSLHRIGAGP